MSDSQGQATAEAPKPPVITGEPREIADGVFLIPDEEVDLVPNIGVVVGERSALVIDSGLGPRNGGIARKMAKELAGDRPLFLTITHFHPEHSFGAQAFAADTIVYNRKQHEELREKGAGYKAMFSGIDPAIAAELADVQFVDPDVVYEGSAEIDLGGRKVELVTWGPAHTREDQGVYLAEEKILFVGDLIERRSFPVLSFFPPNETEVDARKWLGVLDRIGRMHFDVVVPGHGKPGGPEVIAPSYDYLQTVISKTEALADAGEDPEKIPGIVVPELIAANPEWEAPPDWLLAAGVQSVLAHRGEGDR